MRLVLTAVLFLAPLSGALFADDASDAQRAKDRAVVETLLRLKGVDVNSSPAWKAAVTRHLQPLQGTTRYVDIVEGLRLKGVEEELLRLALEDPASTVGARATAALMKAGEGERFRRTVQGKDESQSLKAIAALGSVADATVVEWLKPLVIDDSRDPVLRIAAASAIANNRSGQAFLLGLAQASKLPVELKFTVANALLGSADETIRTEAARHLALPASANARPLPPIAELVRMQGDIARGKQVFETVGNCAKCHKVGNDGKDVGPALTEIGDKLSKDAFFVSILDPSAGISHNYETYVVTTTGGTVISGLLISRTDQSATIRTAEGIDRQIPAGEIDTLQKSKLSLMPADLQKALSVQDLVDVVAYLATLKKR